MGRLVSCTLCVALLMPAAGFGAPPPRPPPAAELPPPPPPPPPAVDCFPACRAGFFCYSGQCRSACNPPCGSGEQCLENGQCSSGAALPPGDAPLAPPVLSQPEGSRVSEDGEKAPPGFHFETQRRKGLLIAGPVLFGVGYILSAMYGLFGYSFAGLGLTFPSGFVYNNRSTYLVYAVPLVGPLLSQALFATALGYRGVNRDPEFLFAGIVTVLQTTGLVLALLGIKTTQVAVENRYSSSGAAPIRWSLSPMAPGSPLGVTLFVEN